jgi:Ala-tRNA(Pro) deacylase
LDIGSVTPLGIINDEDNKVTLLLDKELKSEKVLMHPNINTRTLSLHYNDLLKFIEYTNHKYYTF